MTKTLYTAEATVVGGRGGHGQTSDRALDVQLRVPPELGGDGGGTNPEQLFAAGYGACFHGALNLLALRHGIASRGSSVDVTVAFGRDPVDGRHSLTAHVVVRLPGLERTLAERLVRETERICPYAKMVRQGIESSVRVET